MCFAMSLFCSVTSMQAKTVDLADFKASDYDEVAKGATFGGVAFENNGTVSKNDDGHVALKGASAVVDLGETYSLGSDTKVHVEFESTYTTAKNFQIQFFTQAGQTWSNYSWKNTGSFYRFRNNPLDTSDANGIGMNAFTYTGDGTWNDRVAWSFDFDMEKATVTTTATTYTAGTPDETVQTGTRALGLSDLRYFRLYTAVDLAFDNLKVTVTKGGSSSIAYLYDSSKVPSVDEDDQYNLIQSMLEISDKDYDIKAVDTKGNITALTADSISRLQAVIISGSIDADDAIVPALGKAAGTVPMLNCNPELLNVWGWATKPKENEAAVKVTEAGINSGLIKMLDINGGENIYAEDSTVALYIEAPLAYEIDTLGYLRNDRILLKKGNLTLVHQHNAGRNEFITLPWTCGQGVEDAMYDLYGRLFLDMVETKRVVVAGKEPAINLEYHNGKTMVSIAGQDGVDAKLYYTTDGTEPTTASTLYTEPFEVTQADVTIKAIALSDGYTISPVAEKVVDIWAQSESPKIEYVEQDGQTLVILSSKKGDDVLAFTYRQGTTDPVYFQTYTEPITLKHAKTITAIVKQRDGMLQSEPATADIPVTNEKKRNKVLAHFDADPAHYAPGQNVPYYYIGKTDLPVYTDKLLSVDTYKDMAGGDSIVKRYAINEEAQFAFTNDTTGWRVGTGGVVITSEASETQASWGLGNTTHYTPFDAQSDTEEITNCNFSTRKVSTKNADGVLDPGTAYVQTVKPYAGPFDIVTFASGYNSPIEIFVSEDTTKADGGWKKIGEAGTPSKYLRTDWYMTWLRSEVSYEETTPVFVKLLCKSKTNNRIWDIYLYGEGEATGIDNVNSTEKTASDIVRTEVYNVLGQRTDKMERGLNIVKYIHKDGTAETRKIMVK